MIGGFVFRFSFGKRHSNDGYTGVMGGMDVCSWDSCFGIEELRGDSFCSWHWTVGDDVISVLLLLLHFFSNAAGNRDLNSRNETTQGILERVESSTMYTQAGLRLQRTGLDFLRRPAADLTLSMRR